MIKFRKSKNLIKEKKTIRVEGRKIRLLILKHKDWKKRSMQEKTAGVLWLHGGGYVVGMKEMVYLASPVELVEKFGLTLIAPDYTLASKKHHYPEALNDCYAALSYLKDHAEELKVRDDQLFVGGESAGGGLCAALCMKARDEGKIKIAFQTPLYPMIDDRDTPTSENNRGKVWNTRSNHYGWKQYLGPLYGSDNVPPYAAPARQTDYRNLPPCYTFVGDLEPFFAETMTFIRNLQDAGVEASVDIYGGEYHAFDMIDSGSKHAEEAEKKFLKVYEDALKNYHAVQN